MLNDHHTAAVTVDGRCSAYALLHVYYTATFATAARLLRHMPYYARAFTVVGSVTPTSTYTLLHTL